MKNKCYIKNKPFYRFIKVVSMKLNKCVKERSITNRDNIILCDLVFISVRFLRPG